MDKNSLMDQLDRAVGAHGPVLVKISVFGQPVWLDITGVMLSSPNDPPSVDHAIVLTTSMTPRAAVHGTGPSSLPATVLGPQGRIENQDNWDHEPIRPQRPISPLAPPAPSSALNVRMIPPEGWTDADLQAAGIKPGTPQDQLVPGIEGHPEYIKGFRDGRHPMELQPEHIQPERRYAEPDFRHLEPRFPVRDFPEAPLSSHKDIGDFSLDLPRAPLPERREVPLDPQRPALGTWVSDLLYPDEPATRIQPEEKPDFRAAHPRPGEPAATERVVTDSPFVRDEASHAFAGSEEISAPELAREPQIQPPDVSESMYDGLREDNLPEGQS